MFRWFLNFLERKGRKHVILDSEGIKDYLIRYYILYPDSVKRERKDIPFNAFIHQFMASDDPVLHTHPWSWSASLILKGGYWEHLPTGKKWRGPGSFRILRRGKSDVHWIEIPEPGKTWTLFLRGRTVSSWGFMPDAKTKEVIPWREYLEQHRVNASE